MLTKRLFRIKPSRVLPLTGIAILVTACGYTATPPLWKNWVSDDALLKQTNVSAEMDTEGNTWQEFHDAEGNHMRLVDADGVERWRQPLASSAHTIVTNAQGAMMAGMGWLTSLDQNGNIRWTQNVRGAVNISLDAQNRVITIIHEEQTVVVTAFTENGTQRWQTSFTTSDPVKTSRVALRNDGSAVILIETQGDEPAVTTRTISGDGVPGEERSVGPVDKNNGRTPWLASDGEHMMAFIYGNLYGLNDDGSVAWQRSAPPPGDNQTAYLGCTKPGVNGTACYYVVASTDLNKFYVHIDWINNAGDEYAHKGLPVDSPVDMIGNGENRWALVEAATPDTYTGLEIFNPKPQHVVRLHMLDDHGKETEVINMDPSAVSVANCLGYGCIPMTYIEPAEFYFNGGVTNDRVIVAGTLSQDTYEPRANSRSFIVAFGIK